VTEGRTTGPLPPAVIASVSVSFDALTVGGGEVRWLQTHPHGGGAASVVGFSAGGGVRELTPAGFAVGTRIHAYGGGAYAASGDGLWCVNATDNRIYRVGSGDIRSVVEADESVLGYGDLTVSDGELLCVRETTAGRDELVAVPAEGGPVRVLLDTAGFLAAPRIGDGRLALLRWGADQMPWDNCELWVFPYTAGGSLGRGGRVAGGRGESAGQPVWGPGGELFFVSDRTGWWNVYRWPPVADDRAHLAWRARAGWRNPLHADARRGTGRGVHRGLTSRFPMRPVGGRGGQVGVGDHQTDDTGLTATPVACRALRVLDAHERCEPMAVPRPRI
jgi:hypothetical protein